MNLYVLGDCWLHGRVPHRKGHNGLSCVPCRKIARKAKSAARKARGQGEAQRRWKEANPAAHASHQQQFRNSVRGRAGTLLHSAKIRAAQLGLPFNLTAQYLHEALTAAVSRGEVTPVSGHPHTASLDQIVPRGGYVEGNVQIVPAWYNFGKNRYSEPAFVDAVTRWATARRG